MILPILATFLYSCVYFISSTYFYLCVASLLSISTFTNSHSLLLGGCNTKPFLLILPFPSPLASFKNLPSSLNTIATDYPTYPRRQGHKQLNMTIDMAVIPSRKNEAEVGRSLRDKGCTYKYRAPNRILSDLTAIPTLMTPRLYSIRARK